MIQSVPVSDLILVSSHSYLHTCNIVDLHGNDNVKYTGNKTLYLNAIFVKLSLNTKYTEKRIYIHCTLLTISGIPSRPGPPVVSGSGNPVTVTVTTEHSGVRDSAVDEFHFILEV